MSIFEGKYSIRFVSIDCDLEGCQMTHHNEMDIEPGQRITHKHLITPAVEGGWFVNDIECYCPEHKNNAITKEPK